MDTCFLLCRIALMEDVTKSLPAALAVCSKSHHNVRVCGSQAEEEKWSNLSIMKRDGTGDSSGVERPALLPRTIVMLQPEPLLRAMSELVAIQHQRSVLMSMTHLSTREHSDFSGQSSLWGPHRCLWTVQNWPCPSLVQHFRELTSSFSSSCS